MVPGAALALLLGAGAAAQTAPEKPFVERVEVNVRTVLVRITDKDGKAPSPLPRPEDLAVFEDGAAVRVLGVDPATAGPPAQLPTPSPGQPTRTPAPEAPPATAPAPGIPQHLYVDATLLDAGSVTRLATTFGKSLPQILTYGTLEIVAADPQPRQLLAATRDEPAVRKALAELARTVSGKQLLQISRRQTMDTLRNGFCVNYESTIRNAAEQDLRVAQDSLDRLLRWAASLGGQRPDVVYFVVDGFDSDPTETYRQVLLQRSQQQPTSSLCSGTLDPVAAQQLSTQLQQEFAPQSGALIGGAARSLATLGVEAVPIALGANAKDFGGDASTAGQDGFTSTTGTIPLFARPIDPLRVLADATGGEVVTSANTFAAAVDAYGTAFVVSFRTDHPPDGKTHDLRIESLRPGLAVRGPKFMSGSGTEAATAGQTVRALNEPPAPSAFNVRLSVDGVARSGKDFTGMLHVDADLSSLVSTLEHLDGGKIRLTIAVDVAGARDPFTTRQEFDTGKTQAAWGADIPITWPAKGRKVAVTVEELKTGARGTGTVDLPK
jgi:hypothetical protein